MISPGASELHVHSLGSTFVTLRPARQLRSKSVPKLSNIVVHNWYVAGRITLLPRPRLELGNYVGSTNGGDAKGRGAVTVKERGVVTIKGEAP